MAGRTHTLTEAECRPRSTLEAVESRGRASAALAISPSRAVECGSTLSQLRLLGFSFLNFGLGNSGMALLLLFSHKFMGYT